MVPEASSSLDALYREHGQRLIARLVRISGRVDWAEAAVHDAFVKAVEQFERELPADPLAWLYRVARNRLTDRARRASVRQRAEATLTADQELVELRAPTLAGDWDDELLEMIVATCDPALTPDEQVALSLRILCGLPQASIASIFRARPETIKKRLSSAKRKLRQRQSIAAPDPRTASDRVDVAMRVIYAVFTEGHKPRSGPSELRADLCRDAIRLAEVLLRKMPDHAPELHALLALFCLAAARLPAREGVVLLEHQNRDDWDRGLIDRGLVHLRASAAGHRAHGLSPRGDDRVVPRAGPELRGDRLAPDRRRLRRAASLARVGGLPGQARGRGRVSRGLR